MGLDIEIGNFYVIEVELTAGAGAATSTLPAEPIGGMPFVWEELGAFWNTTNGDWQIRISDNSANRYFSSMEVKVAGMVGIEQKPYELKTPYTFQPGSAIMVEGTNDGGAGDTLFLSFLGKRLPPTLGSPAP